MSWQLDPLLHLVATGWIVVVLARAVVEKLSSYTHYVANVGDYRLLPAALVAVAAPLLLAAATAFFFDAVILLIFGEKQRGVPKIVKGVFNEFHIILPYDRILVGFLAGVIILGFILFMKYSRPGRAMRALMKSELF